jgi:hypothetical protein
MKKNVFIPCLGLLAALALAFIFTACDDGTKETGAPALTGNVNLENQSAREDDAPGTIKMGDTVEAKVSGSNASAGALKYQWQKRTGSTGDFTNITGANTNTYEIATPVVKNDYIRVVVTATGFTGSRESNAALVSPRDAGPIEGSVTIATDPAGDGDTVDIGDTVKATVTGLNADATALYQWQKAATNADGSFTDIANANSQTFDTTGFPEDEYLRVVVTAEDFSGEIKSNVLQVIDPTKYTVTFNSNGGSAITSVTREVVDGSLDLYDDEEDEWVYKPEKTYDDEGNDEDIEFLGWYVSTDSTRTLVKTIDHTVTLVAEWKFYIVTLDPSGGAIPKKAVGTEPDITYVDVPLTQIVNARYKENVNDVAFKLSTFSSSGLSQIGDPEKDDYTFIRWCVEDDRDTYIGPNSLITRDFTLLALYTPLTVITFDPNGGTFTNTTFAADPVLKLGAGTSLTRLGGDATKFALATRTAESLIYVGWYKQGDTDQTLLLGPDPAPISMTVPSENITLVAKWVPLITVTAVLNGGSVYLGGWTTSGDTRTTTVAQGATINLTNNRPTRTGFLFDRWYADAALTIPAVFPMTITTATSVYAGWIDTAPDQPYTGIWTNGTTTYILSIEDSGYTGWALGDTIKNFTWTGTSIDGKTPSVNGTVLTLGAETFNKATETKTPGAVAALHKTYTKGDVTLTLGEFFGFINVSLLVGTASVPSLSYAADADYVYLVQTSSTPANLVVLTIPRTADGLEGWTNP